MSVCELTITCTKGGDAEKEILNARVQGLYDVEARDELLSKEPQLDLAATVIEGKETGRRSAGIMLGGTPAIGCRDGGGP